MPKCGSYYFQADISMGPLWPQEFMVSLYKNRAQQLVAVKVKSQTSTIQMFYTPPSNDTAPASNNKVSS